VGEGCEHNVIEGIEEAVKKMRKLQQTRLQIAPKYGWGHDGNQEFGIPPGATITYEVTLLDYVKVPVDFNVNCMCIIFPNPS